MDYPNLIHWAIPFFVVLLLAEVLFNVWDHKDLFKAKDTFASLSMGIGNVLVGLVAKGLVFTAFSFFYQFRIFEIGTVWWAWVVLFFAEDLAYYIFHRVSHESRFFWASHVIHHSSQYYNLGTALRQTWTGSFTSWIFWIWLPIIGFHPMMIMMMQSVSLIYQFWIHTELIRRLPRWVEYVFNTPSHHRVHHASNSRYLDRNHAGVLIIWDRMFGTFEPEVDEEPPVYGLTKNITTYNPFKIAFHEWVDMFRDAAQPGIQFKDRVGYLFNPPGWSHDGSGKTSEQLRAEWRQQKSSKELEN
jgi:sterol desaturase/sphingolipid hydroxylase (fatty acid hydroxylase superfamily)